MADKKKPGGGVGISAAAIGKSVTDALTASFRPMLIALNKQTKVIGGLTSEIRDMRASASLKTQEDELEEILAGAAKKKKVVADDDDDIDAAGDDDDADDDGEELVASAEEEVVEDDDDVAAAGKKMKAKKKKDDEEPDPEDPDEADEDEDEVDAAIENLEDDAAEEEPGEVNKRRGGKNKGSKTTVTAAAVQGLSPKLVKMIRAQGSELVTLRAQAAKDKKQMAKLTNKVSALQAQATRFAEQVERKSLPPELRALLSKSGYDVADMQATGVKLTVEQLDEVIQGSGINFSIKDRYALKNVLYAKNLLERGDVVRN